MSAPPSSIDAAAACRGEVPALSAGGDFAAFADAVGSHHDMERHLRSRFPQAFRTR
jgi:hypothetical protein